MYFQYSIRFYFKAPFTINSIINKKKTIHLTLELFRYFMYTLSHVDFGRI